MSTQPYIRSLEAAEFILGPPAIKGIPLWRGRGIDAVRLLVESFVDLVRARHPVRVVEHGFLASQAENRRVFGDYTNVYELLDMPKNPDGQFRSDNIVSSVALLDSERTDGPLVSVGAVMRSFSGKTSPLFRDRMIWPVVELNQLADGATAVQVLEFYRSVIEAMLHRIGLPSITVCTDELSGYGKITYLVVTALPDRRLTVLATLYVLADRLRNSLSQHKEIVDVGFTGKVLATMAMVHTDLRGLKLPSAIAPVQLGITVAPDTDLARCEDWFQALRGAGIRFGVARASSNNSSRARAEISWHRKGVPLVVGLDRSPGSVVLCTRPPIERVRLSEWPDAPTIRAQLDAHDERLRWSALRLMTAACDRDGQVRTLCGPCVAALGTAVFGQIVPMTTGACDECGGEQGRKHLISEEGRFY